MDTTKPLFRSRSPGGQSVRMSAPKSGGSGAVIGIVSAMAIIVSLLCGSTILINSGKVLAFEVLGAVLITVLVANLRTQGLVQRFKENVLSGPNPLVLALLVYTAFSFLLGPTSKWYTMNEMVRVAICAAVYFGVLYNLRERLTMMMDVIMATAAAVAVFGLVSVGDSGFDRMDGISGSFGTHEALGSFLMLMLPITAAIGIFNKVDQKRRVAALAVSLLVVVCLAFTQSRSGWISELVAMGALALMAAKFYPRAKVGAKQRFAAAVPFLAFIGIAGLLLAISGAGSDVLHRASTFGSGSTDISWKERLMLWHAAITMIAAKPLFGWGLGSFPYIAAKLTPVAASATTVANFGANLRNIAHNYYLQTAAETGLVGLGLYLGMVVTFFTVGVRALGKLQDGTRKMVLIGVLAAMAGQVVDAATSPSYNIASVSMFQWLLMGVGMFAAGVPKQKEEAAVAALAFQQPSRYLTVRRGMARVLAVCACMSVMMFTVGSSDSAIADSYTTTVTHNEGVSNTGAILIGVGGLIVGYIIGYELGHHDHNDQPS